MLTAEQAILTSATFKYYRDFGGFFVFAFVFIC